MSPPVKTNSSSSPRGPVSRHSGQGACRPHLANPAQTSKLRGALSQTAKNNPSVYGFEVRGMNHVLNKLGTGISCDSFEVVKGNLKDVHAGKIPEYMAHFKEASSFAQDAVQSFKHGHLQQGAVETFGAVLNADAAAFTLVPGLVQQGVNTVASAFQSFRQWLHW